MTIPDGGRTSRAVAFVKIDGVHVVRIAKKPGVCGGDACIRSTRLAVWGLVEWKRLGWDDARFFDAYPQLTGEDLAAAWEYAEVNPEEIERSIRENTRDGPTS